MDVEQQREALKKLYDMNLESSEYIESGVSHKNYIVATDKGKFVLKLIAKSNLEINPEVESAYLDYLQDQDFPVNRPLKEKGEYFLDYGDFLIALFPYIKHASDQVTAENIAEVGDVVGRLNTLEIPAHLHPRSKRMNIWKQFVEEATEKGLVDDFLKVFNPLRKRIEEANLPQAIIHADIWTGNLLFDDKNHLVGIIDWESVDIQHRLFEITIVAVGCCYKDEKLDIAMYKKFIDAYDKEAQLTDLEKKMLYDYLCFTILYCVAWRYVKFNIRKLDEKLIDFYKPMFQRYYDLREYGQKTFEQNIF